jgi:hypothetical protein
MAIRPKYVWWCLVVVLGVLAFFNIFSWPKDSAAAMKMLNAIDEILFRPAAHPTMLALVVGLALGTVVIPEAWRVLREHTFPVKPRPNMDLRDAVDYLRVRSRWAIGRVYSADDNHLLEEDIDGIIRDAATQGRIIIWGRPQAPGTLALFVQPTEIEIPSSEWPNLGFDLTTLVDDGVPNGVCTWDMANTGHRFCELRVNRAQIYREWRRAFYGRLLLDRTWKSRKRKA